MSAINDNSVFEARQRIMALKNERLDCELRAQSLAGQEGILRKGLQDICDHGSVVGIRGDVCFDQKRGVTWSVGHLIAPLRLCCVCGLKEIGIFSPDVETQLRQTLLQASLHPSDLIDRAARFAVLVIEPIKRVCRDVYEDYLRRDGLDDPLILGPVLRVHAPVTPLAVSLIRPKSK